jgi:hypothetical protein
MMTGAPGSSSSRRALRASNRPADQDFLRGADPHAATLPLQGIQQVARFARSDLQQRLWPIVAHATIKRNLIIGTNKDWGSQLVIGMFSTVTQST